MVEALAIDRVSSSAAKLAGASGAVFGGPLAPASGYGTTSYGLSKAGNDTASRFNNWFFPTTGLGP